MRFANRTRTFRITLAAVVLASVVIAALPGYLGSKQRPLRWLKAWALESELLADTGVIFQTTASNCGHSALIMILRHLGRPVPMDLIDRAGSARWGLSVAELVRESHAAGVPARVRVVDVACLERALARVPVPAVALLGTHFVVVEGRPQSGTLAIIDPGLGRLRMPMRIVRREWRDALITFGDERPEVRAALCG